MNKTLSRHMPEMKGTDYSFIRRRPVYDPGMFGSLKTTLLRHEPVGVKIESNKETVGLKRNNKILLRLRLKLKSYLYEPNTYEMFDRVEYLKDSIETQIKRNTEIIGFLNHHRQSVTDYLDYISYARSNFHDLKLEIDRYMRDARTLIP